MGKTFCIKTDHLTLEVNKKPIEGAGLRAAMVKADVSTLAYTFKTALSKIQVVYELGAGWRFVSKQILVSALKEGSFSVDRVEPLYFELKEGVCRLYVQYNRYPMIAQEEYGTKADWQETGTKACDSLRVVPTAVRHFVTQ